jgi:hypothetical protein
MRANETGSAGDQNRVVRHTDNLSDSFYAVRCAPQAVAGIHFFEKKNKVAAACEKNPDCCPSISVP